jgi:hypothetical protein
MQIVLEEKNGLLKLTTETFVGGKRVLYGTLADDRWLEVAQSWMKAAQAAPGIQAGAGFEPATMRV